LNDVFERNAPAPILERDRNDERKTCLDDLFACAFVSGNPSTRECSLHVTIQSLDASQAPSISMQRSTLELANCAAAHDFLLQVA